jgi:hypothetical protein
MDRLGLNLLMYTLHKVCENAYFKDRKIINSPLVYVVAANSNPATAIGKLANF